MKTWNIENKCYNIKVHMTEATTPTNVGVRPWPQSVLLMAVPLRKEHYATHLVRDILVCMVQWPCFGKWYLFRSYLDKEYANPITKQTKLY